MGSFIWSGGIIEFPFEPTQLGLDRLERSRDWEGGEQALVSLLSRETHRKRHRTSYLCKQLFISLFQLILHWSHSYKTYRVSPCKFGDTQPCRNFCHTASDGVQCLCEKAGRWEDMSSPPLPWAKRALVLDLQIIIMTDRDNKKSHENRSCKEGLD